MVQEIFLEHVAKEILNIRLPNFEVEDSVAWRLEKNGVFSVRSAYRLALDLRSIPPPTTSTSLNGDRSLWNIIWKADAPPKIKIFTWKLATNSLAVQTNRCRRLPDVLPICSICGQEDKSAFHATMSCTKSVALRHGLRKVWSLPTKEELRYTGWDWVLVLLDKLPSDMRVKLMFLWWRAWHHRNDVIFGKGGASIENSIRYLHNYLVSPHGLKKETIIIDRKGKGIQAVKTCIKGRQTTPPEPSFACREKPSVG
jgi:hypothetical protein